MDYESIEISIPVNSRYNSDIIILPCLLLLPQWEGGLLSDILVDESFLLNKFTFYENKKVCHAERYLH